MDPTLPDVPDATARLSFRPWRADDAAAFLDMYSRPEVYRFLGARPSPVLDLDEARSRIEARHARTAGIAGSWAIDLIDAAIPSVGGPIGAVLLVPLTRSDGEPSDVHEIGWHLHPSAWGHGYATEAAQAVIARARMGGLSEVRAVVFPANAASHAVCRRLGMSEVGLTSQWYGVELVEYRLALGPDVSVAAAAGDDWQVLRALRRAALNESPYSFAADPEAERAEGEVQWRLRISADSWAVARVGGEPTGLLAVSIPDERHAADGWIHSWWIAPGARGRGISRAMLDWVFALGRGCGWSRIGLGVWVENVDAIAAFAALGFVGRDPRPSARYPGKVYVAMFRDIP